MLNKEIENIINVEFNLNHDIYYLNHAAVSPWPARTQQAVVEFANENITCGSIHYPSWLRVEQKLRESLSYLVNAKSSDEIALLKNTSEALSVVAYGLDWKTGDNIVISDEEFPSNRIVWESLKKQGVKLKYVDLSSAQTPEDALLDAIDSNTKLLSISSVQYATGLKLDLSQLGRYCRQKNVLFCVDAIQSVGACTIDVQRCNIDFLMADGHKWMLAPEGLALFYCRTKYLNYLKLHQFGWHMIKNHHDFSQLKWTSAVTGRRFECGSPNMLGIHALQASLSLLLEIGISAIEQMIQKKAQLLFDLINKNADLQLITSQQANRYAGIVTFKSLSQDNIMLYQYLMDNRVMCAYRGGGIRFSPHFYTSETTIKTAMYLLEKYQNNHPVN